MSMKIDYSPKYIYMFFGLALIIGAIGYAPWVLSSCFPFS